METIREKLEAIISKAQNNITSAWNDRLDDTSDVIILQDFKKCIDEDDAPEGYDCEEDADDLGLIEYNGWFEDLVALVEELKPNTMKTKETNRMIADFMGANTNPNGTFELPQFKEITFNGYFKTEFYDEQLKYHTSWDWLMTVVDKIELLGYSVERNFQRVDKDWQCLITKGNDILFQEFAYDSIEAMYQVVVSFIEFYNKP